jgi:Tfp pilus assembly protein PilN
VITSNLATRPFYNERVVHLWLAILFVLVVAATAFNVTRVVRYSHSDTELGTQATSDERRAADLRAQAAKLRASVDPKQIEFASTEARQANDLIDRRVFSWTELFNEFEMALPDEVRLSSVRPRRERGQLVLTIGVVARSPDDVSTFMDNLEGSGHFAQVGSKVNEFFNQQGQLEATFDTNYTAEGDRPPAGEKR